MSKYKLMYYSPNDTNHAIVEMTDKEAIALKRILSDANKQVENSYVGSIEVGEKLNNSDKPKTNAERIRAMSDEELAEFFYLNNSTKRKEEHWLEWLQSEVEE